MIFPKQAASSLSGLERTVVGRFLSTIPMSIVLVTMPDARVRFLNCVAEEMLKEFALVIGDPLFKLVKSDVQSLQRALNKLYVSRKQQRLEAWITGKRIANGSASTCGHWRFSSERLALVLIEDLTTRKRR